MEIKDGSALRGRSLVIHAGSVFRDGQFARETLYVQDGRFVRAEDFHPSEPSDTENIHAEGLLILPGLTDIHFHGARGQDLCDLDPEGLRLLLQYEASIGVTQALPATLTLSDRDLSAIFSLAADYMKGGVRDGEAWLCGLHMEGPYINPEKLGAQNPHFVRQGRLEDFRRYQALSGDRIRVLSLAPEMEGALDFIRDVHGEFPDLRISLAHTRAAYETAISAFRSGASHVTHLFNAMSPLHHREPGVVGAAFDQENVSVEMITDGIHLHPAIIRAGFSLFPGRVVLISDSMRATGLEDGSYTLGGQEVRVSGKRATLKDGSLAGSVTNLYDGMRFAVASGIPMEAAIRAASEYPAARIGIEEEAGSLKPGRRANFIIADQQLNRQSVYVNGQRISPLPAQS